MDSQITSIDKPKIKFNVISVVSSFRKEGDREVCLDVSQKGKESICGWFFESNIQSLLKQIEKKNKEVS